MTPQTTARALLFAKEEIKRLPPVARGWIELAAATKELAEGFEKSLTKIDDVERARNWRKKCFVEGTSPADYLNHLVTIDGRAALLELRFKGLDKDAPFVEVVAHEGPTDIALIRGAIDAAKDRYPKIAQQAEKFSLGFTLSRGDLSGDALKSTFAIEHDLETVAGHSSELTARELLPQASAIVLDRMTDDTGYGRYVDTMRAFLLRHPILENEIWIPDVETFSKLVDSAQAYDVEIEGVWGGVIVAVAHPYFGTAGWLIHEEVLASHVRGRGFAPAMQQKLVRELDRARPGIVHGTIHHLNAASLATARRTGRLTVAEHLFVAIDGGDDNKGN